MKHEKDIEELVIQLLQSKYSLHGEVLVTAELLHDSGHDQKLVEHVNGDLYRSLSHHMAEKFMPDTIAQIEWHLQQRIRKYERYEIKTNLIVVHKNEVLDFVTRMFELVENLTHRR